MPGQIVAMDVGEAARLRAMGLIGLAGPERAVKPPAERPAPDKPEQAVKEPSERRKRKPKAQEVIEDVADLSDPSGD